MNEIVSGVVEMGTGLQFTEDKLTTMMDAAQVSQAAPSNLAGHTAVLSIVGLLGDLCIRAQVMGMVGCLRKRVLLLWQAVQLSRNAERPNLSTLQVKASVWLFLPCLHLDTTD